MDVNLSFFLALMMLLPHFHCLNWQGTGNMPSEMMTAIWNNINTNFETSKTYSAIGNSYLDSYVIDFATGLSDDLNGRFGHGWNVVVVMTLQTSPGDTVVYGYAFREHWFWYNGLAMSDGSFTSFIIWKDYNCQTYISYNPNAVTANSNYDLPTQNALTAFTNAQATNWRYDDIWSVAYSYVENLQKQSGFTDKAFSMIIAQTAYANIFSRVCALKYFSKTPIASNGQATGGTAANWGAFFAFQMR